MKYKVGDKITDGVETHVIDPNGHGWLLEPDDLYSVIPEPSLNH